MKFLGVLILTAAVFADVSHLKQSTDRHYLPPERTVHEDYHHNNAEHHYIHSKPKAIPDPDSLPVPHKFSNTYVADLPLRQKLFTPAGEADGDFNQPQGSDHVVYATAPNSVFHTQINVQSQGSEFNVPKTEPINAENEEENRSIGGSRAGSLKNDNLALSRSYKNDDRKQHQEHYRERTFKQEKLKPKVYDDEHTKRTYHNSENSRSYDEGKRADNEHHRKRPNYQGLNLINGNIAADQAGVLPNPPNHLNGNTQGINIINGNLLGKREPHELHEPQFGYKPKQYDDQEHGRQKTSIHHKTGDVFRQHTSHDEYHDNHLKKVNDDNLPRKYDSHKEFDYHKISDEHYKRGKDNKHNHNERIHDHDYHHQRKHEECDHNEKEQYKEHHDQHDQRNYHKSEKKNENYHHEQREHYDHHDKRQHNDHDHHDDHNNQQHHDHQYDHREHYKHRENHYHHDNYEKSQHNSRQYNKHEKPHKYQHELQSHHERSYERETHKSDLHDKPKNLQSIISKPAIKIIAFNSNSQPNLQVTPVQAQANFAADNENSEEYDSSASAPEVIYKPGDEIDFAETKLIDFHDNRRPLDSYNVSRKKPQQRNQHSETDLREDGYHYGKPKVSFHF